MSMDKEKVIDILTGRNSKGIVLYPVISAWAKDTDRLKSRTARIHRIMSFAAWGLFIASLLKMAVVFRTLPDEMGIHFIGMRYVTESLDLHEKIDFVFRGYQHYDVVGTKLYILYPYGISFLALALCGVMIRLSKKVKSNMTDNDTLILRSALTLTLDAERLVCTVYFCVIWTELMIRQIEMRALCTGICLFLELIFFFDLILFVIQLKKFVKKQV